MFDRQLFKYNIIMNSYTINRTVISTINRLAIMTFDIIISIIVIIMTLYVYIYIYIFVKII